MLFDHDARAQSEKVTAEGFAFDPSTREWTKRTTYEARDRIEAIRWMNFNRDWMKGLRIVDGEAR